LNVTALIAMVSRAHANILGLRRIPAQHIVLSDWSARAVLRFWRLKKSIQLPLAAVNFLPGRPSVTLVGHALVLALGFVLVVPAMSYRAVAIPAAAQPSGGLSVLRSVPFSGGNAAETRDIIRAEKLEVGVSPSPAALAAPPAAPPPVVASKAPAPAPKPVSTFTPPPGSGGDGLAAIYAVFGNSPGLSWALRVANCESHYNPLAVNRSSGASGLFQFMPSTWNANFPGQNIWDPYAQARGALVFYNAGRQSAWTCK
jgi:hypothetical protein